MEQNHEQLSSDSNSISNEAKKTDIKIFVSHRIDQDSQCVDNPLYIPIRCGAVYDTRPNVTMLGDDTGINVSEKRMSYCELTVQYWAWKNIQADYYGLCHYRRYLSFSDNIFPEHNQNSVIMDSLSTAAQELCGILDEDNVRKHIEKYDIITCQSFDVGATFTPGGEQFKTVYDYWYKGWADFLITKKNLDLLYDTIIARYPNYKKDLDELFKSNRFRGYNCFVMKKEAFFDLCSFEFPIMEELESLLDMSGASNYRNRTLGYCAEILYTLWIYRAIKYKLYTVDERQLVTFLDTTLPDIPTPEFKDPVTVVFNAYVHDLYLLHPLVQSLIENSSPNRNYELIVIFQHSFDLGKREKRVKSLLMTLVDNYPNIVIKFIDPKEQLGVCDLGNNTEKEQCREQEVYRLLLPWILPNHTRAVYLSPLAILNTDVANLYDYELDGKTIGAVRDIFFNGCYFSNKVVASHVKNYLSDINVNNYFDIDIFVMDLEKARTTYNKNSAIDIHWQINDNLSPSDAMNLFYNGDVQYLSPTWNYLEWSDDSFSRTTNWADEAIEKEYSSTKNPLIRNFKFWDNLVDSAYTQDFWKYARKSPEYETLISLLMDTRAHRISALHFTNGGLCPDTRSGIRKFADKILPVGSKRRKVAKVILPPGSLRWRFCSRIYHFFRPKRKSNKSSK